MTRAVPEHKKHAVFPGYRASKDVQISGTTIKGTAKKTEPAVQQKFKPLGPEWDFYEAMISELRNTGKNASSAALQLRNSYEDRYSYASKLMVKSGHMAPIKRKYR